MRRIVVILLIGLLTGQYAEASQDSDYFRTNAAFVDNPTPEVEISEGAASAISQGETGTISGYVLDGNNKPIPQVEVCVYVSGNCINSFTDIAGKYLLRGLPPGEYTLAARFSDANTRWEYRKSNVFLIAGDCIERTFIVDRSGMFSGQVVDNTGSPISKARIDIYNGSQDYQVNGYAMTDSNGSYIIQNLLPGGSYRLKVYPPDGINLVRHEQKDVLIQSGTITTMNISLLPGGTINGIVTDASGNPVNRVEIGCQGNYTHSDANGYYTLTGLPAGNCELRAIPQKDTGLAQQVISGVMVTTGSITVQNIILLPGGTLTGYVRDMNAKPVANARLYLGNTMGGYFTQPQSDGKYTYGGLSDGTYSLAIFPPPDSMLLRKTIEGIQIASGKTTVQDIVLDNDGMISGIVRDSNQQPVSGITVYVLGTQTYSSPTDTNGRYVLSGLLPGRYSICVSIPQDVNLIPQTYQNIVVTLGATTTQNFTLLSGGILTGTITDKVGQPISGIQVDLLAENIQRSAFSDDTGRYMIKGIPTGMYKVTAIPPEGTQYYKETIIGVTIIAGQTSKQDISLRTCSIISGKIVDETGDGLEKVFVVIALPAGIKITIDSFLDIGRNNVHTDKISAGDYFLTLIPTGNYDLYWLVMYDKNNEWGMTLFKSTPEINITNDTLITHRTLTLTSAGGRLYGTVTSPEGYSSPEEICFVNSEGEFIGFVDLDSSNGRYGFRYVPPGTYSLWVRDINGSGWIRIKEGILVEDGKTTTTDIIFPGKVSPPSPVITGLVKNINELPIGEALVTLLTTDQPRKIIATTTTNTDGVFLFGSITQGSYLLRISATGYQTRVVRGFYVSETVIQNVTLIAGEGMSETISRNLQNEILLEKRVRLVIPANSITSYEETINIIRLKESELPSLASSGFNIKPSSIAYNFTPDNLRFAAAATMTLFYTDEEIQGLNEDRLSVFYYDGTKWLHIGGRVNKEENSITFQVQHLSTYAIMEQSSSTKVICYPNPFFPLQDNTCRLSGIPFDARVIRVMIYNIAGELIKTFEPNEIREGMDCRYVEWDGRNEDAQRVGSGVYLYVVESDTGIQRGKIGLIR